MLIRTIHVKATYRFAQRVCVFAAYDWSNEAYTLLDRPDVNDRFYLYDQRLSMGVQVLVAPGWTASLAAGYDFDRRWFEGTSFSSTGFNHVELGAGPFTSLNLGARSEESREADQRRSLVDQSPSMMYNTGGGESYT